MVLLSGDLVIAMALALWLAVGTPSRRIEVGALDNYCWCRLQRTGAQATSSAPTMIPVNSTPQALRVFCQRLRYFRGGTNDPAKHHLERAWLGPL
jgi:hypothetical protein